MASVKNFHHPGDLDPYPAADALSRLHPRSRRAPKVAPYSDHRPANAGRTFWPTPLPIHSHLYYLKLCRHTLPQPG